MKAESRTLQRIFEQSIRYCVPLFQRPYVCNKSDNWEPLWEDIRRLAEQRLSDAGSKRTHFIGAIVVEQLPGSTGSIDTRQVIDGQQRLTTLQIILTVLKDLSRDSGWSTFEKRFEKFSRNDSAFIDTEDEAFKVWPTNPDRAAFRITLGSGKVATLNKRVREARGEGLVINDQIPKAYIFFAETIREWLKEIEAKTVPEQGAELLWHVISGQLRLVAIDLEAEDDPQVIFETLNSRGAPLLPADLVKNYLFRRAQADGIQVDKLYEQSWKPFDTEWWREKMRQGRLKRPRLDIFLQHYLSLKTRDDVLVTHIFKTYQEYATPPDPTTAEPINGSVVGGTWEGSIKESAPVVRTAEELIKELAEYGRVFQRLVLPHSRPRIALFLTRLEAIDTATIYPFLLEAFRLFDNSEGLDELESIVSTLESFLVRRMVCGLTTKNYNRVFLELLNYCEENGGVSSSALVAFLEKSDADTARWPDDLVFTRALNSLPLYKQLARPKLRLVLRAIDSVLQTGKSEEILLGDELTIEHLLPDKWKEHWPITENDEAKKLQFSQTRDVLKHSIGNLTLLTKKLNPAISNSAWSIKRPEILKESKLNLNRAFQEVHEWNEETIQARSKDFAFRATRIWPRE